MAANETISQECQQAVSSSGTAQAGQPSVAAEATVTDRDLANIAAGRGVRGLQDQVRGGQGTQILPGLYELRRQCTQKLKAGVCTQMAPSPE